MQQNQLPPAVLEKLAERLPSGYDAKNVRVISASAVIVPVERPEPLEAALLANFETAGGVSMITDGKPTIMRIVAWVAHEGVNKNRAAFVAEDLVEAAASIAPPNVLPMDFNHSAVMPWTGEQAVIGTWYAAEVRDNPQARPPRGPKGLLARGMMWSWAFPEYSTRLLAEQARHGHIEFSMACVSEWIEPGRDADGEYEVLRKPVFLTFAALDIPPGDPDAVGLGEEGGTDADVEQQLEQQLQAAALNEESKMDEKLQNMVAEIMALLKEKPEDLATKEDIEGLEGKLKEIVALNPGEVAELTAKVESLTGKVQELEVALQAAKTQAEEANTQLVDLQGQLAEKDAKLEEFAARDAEVAKAEKLAARLAELPEHVRDAHNAQEDEKRLQLEARWAAKSDEEWAEVIEQFSMVPRTASYLARSKDQPKLPNGGSGKSVADQLSKFKFQN